MGINSIVTLLRAAAPAYAHRDILLPVEMVEIINGKKQENSLKEISAGRVMQYIADMLEE